MDLSEEDQAYFDKTVISASRSSTGCVWAIRSTRALRLASLGLVSMSGDTYGHLSGWNQLHPVSEMVATHAGQYARDLWSQFERREAIYMLGGEMMRKGD